MKSATDNPLRPVMIVAGPTASGKSSAALDIATEFDGIVINADSMQVYDELRILTARPSEEDEQRAPHRLYGVIEPSRNCSVAQWRDMATAEIIAAHNAEKLPIVTGGSGMYIHALMHGLAAIPSIPDTVRETVQQELESIGRIAMHEHLVDVDPETANRIAPGDTQRLIRAIEVHRSTGAPLSDWLAAGNTGSLDNIVFMPLIIMPPRDELYDRINMRFSEMLDEGALEEVKHLLALDLAPSLSAMKAVGVRELAGYLNGETSLESAVSAAQQASRNYAKRQMTWFRNQIPEAEAIFAQYSESQTPKIFSFIRQFMLT